MSLEVRVEVQMPGINDLPIFNEKGELDFNIIRPMPDELALQPDDILKRLYFALSEGCAKKISAEELMKYGEPYYSPLCGSIPAWIDEYKNMDLEKRGMELAIGNQYLHNIIRYGAPDWYSWRCINWGCKWNARDTKKDGHDVVSFVTPNDCPKPILFAISKMAKKESMEVTWTVEGEMETDDDDNILRYREYYALIQNGVMIDYGEEWIEED